MANEEIVRRSIEVAASARENGNHPFGALLVFNDEIALAAENSVNTSGDPTAHAEMNLIREAVRRFAPEELSRAAVYTSCEPCAMCAGAIYWASIRHVVFGLSAPKLEKMAGKYLAISCREIYATAAETVIVEGAVLEREARRIHKGFWKKI